MNKKISNRKKQHVKLNKKGNYGIPSTRELTITGIIVVVLIFFVILIIAAANSFNKPDISSITNNQQKVADELQKTTNNIIDAVNSQNRAISLLNDNIASLDKTKANEDSVQQLKIQVTNLTTQVNQNNQELATLSVQLNTVQHDLRTIEPSYVQNIDIKNLRTYINIVNFRLVLNFFIAITISLFALEIFKIFGDFLSFGFFTKEWNIKNYVQYKRTLKRAKTSRKVDTYNRHKENRVKHD